MLQFLNYSWVNLRLKFSYFYKQVADIYSSMTIKIKTNTFIPYSEVFISRILKSLLVKTTNKLFIKKLINAKLFTCQKNILID